MDLIPAALDVENDHWLASMPPSRKISEPAVAQANLLALEDPRDGLQVGVVVIHGQDGRLAHPKGPFTRGILPAQACNAHAHECQGRAPLQVPPSPTTSSGGPRWRLSRARFPPRHYPADLEMTRIIHRKRHLEGVNKIRLREVYAPKRPSRAGAPAILFLVTSEGKLAYAYEDAKEPLSAKGRVLEAK